jgi:hypothetical protein
VLAHRLLGRITEKLFGGGVPTLSDALRQSPKCKFSANCALLNLGICREKATVTLRTVWILSLKIQGVHNQFTIYLQTGLTFGS